jgi:hypothetical protein
MADSPGFKRTPSGLVSSASGVFQVGVKSQEKLLRGVKASGRNYVVGEMGTRFTIVLRNAMSCRVECVVSVDGLDVFDGKPASFSKQGHVVDPLATIEIQGFGRNAATLEPFKFKRAEGQQKKNVGVIGVALFHEAGTDLNKSMPPQERKNGSSGRSGNGAAPGSIILGEP